MSFLLNIKLYKGIISIRYMKDITNLDLNEQLQKVGELTKKSNELLEKLGILKAMEEKEAVIFDKEITKFGSSSGHICVPSKYVGHKASVVVKKLKEGGNNLS
jgi:putative transposon-encoded protein